jgi:AbrB family looped-hinge helix DNA binding protein
MILTRILSSNFQITIPKAVREEQHWQRGQQLALIPKSKGLLLIPVPSFQQLQGMAAGADVKICRDRNDRIYTKNQVNKHHV